MFRTFVIILTFGSILYACSYITNTNGTNVRRFPDGFLFGTATASYQIEGAWNKDGRKPSIWDHLTHTNPCAVKDCSDGDIADDSYHLYKRDVEMLRELGVDFYRFSISWSRLLPTSFPDEINEKAVEYYNNVINELLKYKIEPVITLYHWDLPQKLQEMGGWTNSYIVNWFGDYARVAFELFGDRVKYWITINEPQVICNLGYANVFMAPMLNIKGVADYMCTKNLLLAHARAYHIYNKEFKPRFRGLIFIAFCAPWYEPETDNDIEAAEDAINFQWGLYVHPIYSLAGDYPETVKEKVSAKSSAQGFFRSRLIELTPEEIEYIRGTSDMFGLNHYTTMYVYRNVSVLNYYEIPSLEDDCGVGIFLPEKSKVDQSDYIRSVPWGFNKILTKIREDYNNPPVFITENGLPTPPGLKDDGRIVHYRTYLSALLDAVEEGSDVRAYCAWTLMDNFEWLAGYTERFGFYEVDFESATRTRTPRKSAFVYKEIVRTRTLDFSYVPNTNTMTIDDGH